MKNGTSTSPTLTTQEAVSVFRKYGIPMTVEKLAEGIRTGAFPFGQAIELSTWTFLIWRLPLYEYLDERGVPVEELTEYIEEIRARGWRLK